MCFVKFSRIIYAFCLSVDVQLSSIHVIFIIVSLVVLTNRSSVDRDSRVALTTTEFRSRQNE